VIATTTADKTQIIVVEDEEALQLQPRRHAGEPAVRQRRDRRGRDDDYTHFADRDPLTKVVLEQMLAGVSTRRFARTREPVGEVLDAERSSSKSAVSREFVGRTGEHLRALMARSLADVRLAALMLDGLKRKGRCDAGCVLEKTTVDRPGRLPA